MTIWKATALLITKLAELVGAVTHRVLPCSHEWVDNMVVEQTYGKAVTGRLMVQRCAKCAKFRQLKVY